MFEETGSRRNCDDESSIASWRFSSTKSSSVLVIGVGRKWRFPFTPLKPHDLDKPCVVPSDAEDFPALPDIQQTRCYRRDSDSATLRLLDEVGRIVRHLSAYT
jgi:hypothetical protein